MVALACRDRRFLAPMLFAQTASLLSYVPFIADSYIAFDPVWGRAGEVAQVTGLNYGILPLFGGVAMGAALILLMGEAYRCAKWDTGILRRWPWGAVFRLIASRTTGGTRCRLGGRRLTDNAAVVR